MSHKHHTCLLLLSFFCYFKTTAQEQSECKKITGIASGGIYFDQDFLLGKLNEDRNYTMAAGFFINAHFTGSGWFVLPLFLRAIEHNKQTKVMKRLSYFNSSFIAGYSSFTPEDLKAVEPVTDDRPYSCLLHFTSERVLISDQSLPDHKKWSYTHGITFGMLGTEIGNVGQTAIHKLMLKKDSSARPVPLGWHNQISDNLEPTMRYYGRFHFLHKESTVKGIACDYNFFQVSSSVETSIGYYTYVASGIHFKLGYFNTGYFFDEYQGNSNMKLTEGFTKSSLTNMSQAPVKEKLSFTPQFYLFANIKPHLWVYNALLHGAIENTNYRMSFKQTMPFVLNFDVGVRAVMAPMQFSFIFSGRSPEFLGPKARFHFWGSLAASFNLNDKSHAIR